jgi:rod shape determining protein RodA
MKRLGKKPSLNRTLIITIFILLIIGILQIYSAVQSQSLTSGQIFTRQLVWIGIGLLAGIIGFIINPDWLIKHSRYIYGLSILSLFLVIILKKTGLSSSRWISIGFINFQPSEFAKISLILYLTGILTKNKPENLIDLIYPIIITSLPMFLIIFQPDLGTSLIFPLILLMMLFYIKPPIYLILGMISVVTALIAGISGLKITIFYLLTIIILFIISRAPRRDLFILTGTNIALALSSPLLWNFLKDYQKQRIISFLNPTADPLGTGYNIIQSQIAIGSGKIIGKGFLNGSQTHLRFLPVQHTDFIFSVLAEEWGFIGSLTVILLFTIFFILLINIVKKAQNLHYKLLGFGIFSLLFLHTLINIGMSLGLMPVTGLPLPFFSYGGSFMLISLFLMGILLSIDFRSKYYR